MLDHKVIIYFLEALLSVEEPKRDQFTLTVWLLLQNLITLSPEQIDELPDDIRNLLPAKEKAMEEMQAALDFMGADLQTCMGNAGGDEAEETTCKNNASAHLLGVLNAYLPRILVPADWRVAWMGVEG